MKFSKASGALPRTPLGGLQRPPDPQLEKGRATHGLSCFARLAIILLFTFFVLRPDQFLFRCYGPDRRSRSTFGRGGLRRLLRQYRSLFDACPDLQLTLYEKKKYGYLEDILQECVEHANGTLDVPEVQKVALPANIAKSTAPPKEDLVSKLVSRMPS